MTVRSGDTVYGLARRHGVTQQAIINANGMTPPYTVWPGQILRMPSPASYTVAAGDSLYAIARTHGVDVEDLAGLNRLRPPFTIYVGQRLVLPRQSMPAAPPVQQAAVDGSPSAPVPPRRPIQLGGTPPSSASTPARPSASAQRASADARQ
ncbi:MAG: LysM peptidoglycan-binding domain-containing protein, partial [Inquilinus sp.]|nr:LysM peptidoglycan-binding domain-containing protein [Inquilinus sp.]